MLSTTLQENLTGVRVVKAFARQDYEREKFEKDNWEKYRRGRRLLLIHSVYWPSTDILCGLQMLAGFTLAALHGHQRRHQRRHLPGLPRAGDLDHLADAQPGPADRGDVHGLVSYQPRGRR